MTFYKKTKILISIIFFSLTFIFFFANINSSAKTYYVSKTGNDSGDGSKPRPFKSIKKGISKLSSGDTLYVKKGTYYENIFISKSGTKNNLITIKNYNNEKVILNGNDSDSDSDLQGFFLVNCSNIRIDGFEIQNFAGNNTPSGIMVEGYGDNIQLVNNKISKINTNNNAHGIVVYGVNGSKSINNLLIQGNIINDCTLGESESLVVNGNVENFKIINNIIHDNNNIGIDCIGFENAAPSNDQARNGLVKGNKIFNITSKNNPSYGGDISADGIYIDGGKDIKIENNIVYNCDIGIEVASENEGKVTDNINVYNNIVYNCDFGFIVGGENLENGTTTKSNFFNNTLYNNNIGIALQKTEINSFFNNIIYCKYLIEGKIGANKFNHNLWYSKFQKIKIPGTNSKFENPQFINSKKFDFRLKNTSPGISMGTFNNSLLKNSKDILGNPRTYNSKIDCGAYEFTVPDKDLTKTKKNTISATPSAFNSNIPILSNTINTQISDNTKNTKNSLFKSKNFKVIIVISICSFVLIIFLRKVYKR